MTTRIIVGGIVGGIVMFIWGFVSHMLLPLGEAGIKAIPNEDAVITAMSNNIREHAFYIFPSIDPAGSAEQQQAGTEKYKRGPIGILVYNPRGTDPLSPRQLATELLSNIGCALVAAFLLSRTLGSLKGVRAKASFVALIGLAASLSIDVSQWNWYSFPTSFTVASLLDQVVGFLLTGIVLAIIVKQPVARAA